MVASTNHTSSINDYITFCVILELIYRILRVYIFKRCAYKREDFRTPSFGVRSLFWQHSKNKRGHRADVVEGPLDTLLGLRARVRTHAFTYLCTCVRGTHRLADASRTPAWHADAPINIGLYRVFAGYAPRLSHRPRSSVSQYVVASTNHTFLRELFAAVVDHNPLAKKTRPQRYIWVRKLADLPARLVTSPSVAIRQYCWKNPQGTVNWTKQKGELNLDVR